jgi:hypothetical protein
MSIIDQQERAEAEAEPSLVEAAREVELAKVEIRALLAENTERIWTVREVQDAITGWRGTIVRLALFDLERSGEIETATDFSIHVAELQTA